MKPLCKQNYLPPPSLLSRFLPVQSISGLTSSFLPTVTAIRFKFLWALGCQAKEHLPKSWYPLHAVPPSLQEGESVTGWLEAKILRGAGKMGANIEAGTSGLSTPLCCATPCHLSGHTPLRSSCLLELICLSWMCPFYPL